jgi:uncharacterized membrane protein YraQ (UPF0718 family)
MNICALIQGMRKENKSRKETTMKENMGKLMLDVGKLAVGGVIIGGILRSAIPHIILIMGGTIGSGNIIYIRASMDGERKEGVTYDYIKRD